MTKEIKFRAWVTQSNYDSMKNRMFYRVEEEYDGNWDNFGHIIEDSKNGRIILMQYTGLKDKNGKEIYEGDILKFFESKGIYKRSAIIYFDKGRFMCRAKGVPRHVLRLAPVGEIIGNIYENPELLKL